MELGPFHRSAICVHSQTQPTFAVALNRMDRFSSSRHTLSTIQNDLFPDSCCSEGQSVQQVPRLVSTEQHQNVQFQRSIAPVGLPVPNLPGGIFLGSLT